MRIVVTAILFFLVCKFSFAQQLPFWTNHRSNYFMLNPAVTGYKKTFESRLTYRQQWLGFDAAPKTLSFSSLFKFPKDKFGAGFFVYQDRIGIERVSTFSGSFAYHLYVMDLKLSFGGNISYNNKAIDVSGVTFLNSHDKLLNDLTRMGKANQLNGAFGVIIHNEEFYAGFAINNLIKSPFNFKYDNSSRYFTELTPQRHFNVAIGYNWLDNPDFIWENSLIMNYVLGIPLLVDYNIKLYLKDAFYFGAGVRLKTAVYAQLGFSIYENLQAGYSYDFNTNMLRRSNFGSHELKLVYIFDNGRGLHRRSGGFHQRKFQYLM